MARVLIGVIGRMKALDRREVRWRSEATSGLSLFLGSLGFLVFLVLFILFDFGEAAGRIGAGAAAAG